MLKNFEDYQKEMDWKYNACIFPNWFLKRCYKNPKIYNSCDWNVNPLFQIYSKYPKLANSDFFWFPTSEVMSWTILEVIKRNIKDIYCYEKSIKFRLPHKLHNRYDANAMPCVTNGFVVALPKIFHKWWFFARHLI